MDHLPLARYPVRPRMLPLESVAAYCWRIYQANGHSPLSGILQSARQLRPDVTSNKSDPALVLLGKALGRQLLEEEASLLWNKAITGRPKWCVRSLTHRFCPKCIESHGYHTVFWDMPLVTACPFHGCALLNQCTNCRQPFAWHRMTSGYVCKCYTPVRESPCMPASASDLWLSTAVVGSLEFKELVARCGPVLHPLSDFYSGTPYFVWELYGLMNWVLTARNALTYTRWHYVTESGLWDGKPGRQQLQPGPSVFVFMRGLPRSAERCTDRIWKRSFQNVGALLVEAMAQADLDRLIKMTDVLQMRCGELGDALNQVIHIALNRLALGASELSYFSFNPCIPDSRRQQVLCELSDWWRRIIQGVPSVDPTLMMMCPQYTAGRPLSRDRQSVLGRLLNSIVDVSARPLALSDFEVLRARWRRPSTWQFNTVTLQSIVQDLAMLDDVELLILFNAISRDASRHPSGGKHWP